MNMLDTQPEVEMVTPKVKKLKLEPFQLIMANRIEVSLQKFDVPLEYQENEGTDHGYGAVLAMWVATGKKTDFPIMLHLPVAGPCYTRVAYEALKIAVTLCEDVCEEVSVFDGDDELFVLSVEDIIAELGSCDACTGVK